MKRIRISLRLLLLLVALFAALFAWVGERRKLRRVNLRGEMEGIQLYRNYTSKSSQNYTSEKAWRSRLAEMDAEIAKRQNELGDAKP